MISNNSLFYKLTWWALSLLTLTVFVSISVSALHHVLILCLMPWVFKDLLEQPKSSIFATLKPSSWCLLGIVVSGLASNFYNLSDLQITGQTYRAFAQLKYFFLAVIASLAYKQLFKNKGVPHASIKALLNLFLIVVTVATLSGLIGYFTGWNPLRFKAACHPERTCGLYGMYMSYGYGIQFFMVFMTGLLFFYKKIETSLRPHLTLLITAWIINFGGFLLSGARGAYLGFFLSLPFFFLRTHKKIMLIGLCGILLGGAIFYRPLTNLYFGKKREASQTMREGLYTAAIASFTERPLLGLGVRNFEPHSQAIKKQHSIGDPKNYFFAGHAHNNFLEYLASFGFFGFLSLLLFHLFWFKESYLRRDLIGDLSIPLISALTISGMFQHTLGDAANTFLIMHFYALSQIPLNKKIKGIVS